MNTFKPVEIKQFYINRVASAMSQYFYKQIFEKIFQVLEGASVVNSKDDLLNAIKSGKVYYKDGAFRAERFSNAISTTLEKMGATFKNGAYYIDKTLIPLEYIQALGIVQAQTIAKLATIRQVLSNLDLDGADLDRYLEAVVQQMFKSLEVDIVKSAQDKRVPVIELGIVSPKGKIPKAKKLEDYWKTQDEKLERLRKEKEKLKKQRTKDKKENKDTSSIEEKIDEIQSQIEEAKLDAFQKAPQLDVEIDDIELNEQARKIARDYTYNMKYWVKKWEVKNITKMRQDIVDMVQNGARQPEIQAYFENRWKIAKDKAAFLARNESHLAASVIKKTEYEKLGCTKFKWGRSTSKEKRKLHEQYYGKVFDFDNPPIIDEKLNIRGLPRQIWNCGCTMLIVPPTLDEIINKRQKVNNSILGKINGFFKGTQRNNNAWRYRRFGEGSSL